MWGSGKWVIGIQPRQGPFIHNPPPTPSAYAGTLRRDKPGREVHWAFALPHTLTPQFVWGGLGAGFFPFPSLETSEEVRQ